MRNKIALLPLILSLAACADSGFSFGEGPAVTETVQAPKTDSFVLSPSTEGLPDDVTVPTANLYAVPVTTALQAVLYGTDISLSWDSKTFCARPVTVVNLKGELSKVVEKICDAASVSCAFHNGTIELSERKPFVVPVASPAPVFVPKPVLPLIGGVVEKKSDEFPEPVLIDKDGARPVAAPKYAEPMALSPDAKPAPTPLGTIDSDMIQKDFSRAFGAPQAAGAKGGRP